MESSDVSISSLTFTSVSSTLMLLPRETGRLNSSTFLNVLLPAGVDHRSVPVSVTQVSVTLTPSQLVRYLLVSGYKDTERGIAERNIR